jgi:hypothetical protein
MSELAVKIDLPYSIVKRYELKPGDRFILGEDGMLRPERVNYNLDQIFEETYEKFDGFADALDVKNENDVVRLCKAARREINEGKDK